MLDFRLLKKGTAKDADHDEVYDLVILGGGPAGLAAGLYAARAGLNTLIVEKVAVGGQIAVTAQVENCPGCIEGSGGELAAYMQRQATKFGAKITYASVREVQLQGGTKIIKTLDGQFLARSVIIAMGASPNKLGAAGEDEFRGKGISYCVTCDGLFYKDKVVAVIGGGDAAVEEANYLTRFASKVIIIHRRNALRATKVIVDRAVANPRIEFRWDTVVERVLGEQKVSGLLLKNVKTNQGTEIPVAGIFVYIGMVPNTRLFEGQLRLDGDGYIITDEKMQTDIPGVFAAGDVRQTPLRQVITAAADGAIAATYADKYLHNE